MSLVWISQPSATLWTGPTQQSCFIEPCWTGGPLFRPRSLQMVWITSLYGLGFPGDSVQVEVVCRFCVVSTFSRYFSLSLLSDNSPASLDNMRGKWGFVHLHFLYISLDSFALFPCASSTFSHHCILFNSFFHWIQTKQTCLRYSSWQIVLFRGWEVDIW